MAAHSVGVFAVGLLTGYLWRVTNSLWPSIAFHVSYNLLFGLLS
jgi:membrane protease YdiL (CAAX protease family)